MGHLFSDRVPGLPIAGTEEEFPGENPVELRHADFNSEEKFRIWVEQNGVVGGGGEDMPRMGREIRRDNRGFPVMEVFGEGFFQVEEFFFEARMWKWLRFWEIEIASGVTARTECEAETASLVKERENWFEELSCSTGFDDDFCWVDEEARFGKNIGVEEVVSDGGDDRATDGSEDLFEGIGVDLPETHVDDRVIAGETKL